jgi:hypothetical protein
MKTELEEIWVKQLTESISPPLSERTRQRALQGMAQVGPRPGYRRRRLMVMATAALAALVALGFVPVPMGNAPGALAQAIAAAEKARTVHVSGMAQQGYFDKREIWLGDEGYRLFADWSKGTLKELSLQVPAENLFYSYDASTHQAEEFYRPRPKAGASVPLYWGNPDSIARTLKSAEKSLADSTLSEYREGSIWGGDTKIIEITGKITGTGTVICGPQYRAGDKVKIKLAVDPKSGYARSEEEYIYRNQEWQSNYRAEYEWNVSLPGPEVYGKLMVPPPGTLLTRWDWWKEREDRAIATEKNDDWEITLHALDVNCKGKVFVSLSRTRSADSRVPSNYNASFIKIEATDNVGGSYVQSSQCGVIADSWILILLPDNPKLSVEAKNITLKIYTYPNDPTGQLKDEFVSFKAIPLPPRQSGDDLVAESLEKIQY